MEKIPLEHNIVYHGTGVIIVDILYGSGIIFIKYYECHVCILYQRLCEAGYLLKCGLDSDAGWERKYSATNKQC